MINRGKLLIVVFITVLPVVTGCGRDDDSVEVTEEAAEEAPVYEAAGVGEEYESAPGDFDAPAPDIPSLSEIRSVSVETLTGNPRDGFKAEVVYDGPRPEGVGFFYSWEHNGVDISGAVGETLQWREGFKKGDTITVSVTPFSDAGQGVMSAGGGFTIPNSPPVITSGPEASFGDGLFSYTVRAEDPDGDPLDYTLKNAPPGMTIEPAAGHIRWEYGAEDAGVYKVTVVVSDSEGAEAVQEISMNIDPGGPLPE